MEDIKKIQEFFSKPLEETEFHKKLDTLVHDTFGKRKGEMEEESLNEKMLVPTDKIDRMARDIAAKYFKTKTDKGGAIEILKQAIKDSYKILDPEVEIQEETGYSKYLATPDNPKGKTPGLTPDIMQKILTRIANMVDGSEVEEK